MKILVTGATGFIGRHLMRRLLTQHAPSDIACFVKASRTPGEHAEVCALRATGLHLIEGDLNEPMVAAERLPHVDFVFHLAANVDTSASPAALAINDVGCANLLRWLDGSLDGARFLYASSIAVLDRDRPSRGPLNERSPCVPRTDYGRTKLRGEDIIRTEAARCGFQYTILRLATVYGPGEKIDGLFDRLIKDTAKRRLLSRLNWPGRTSIVHVHDVVAIMMSLASRPDAANEIYCVANPDAPTIGALAQDIARVVDPSPDPVHLPLWAWKIGRAVAWSRSVQLLGAAIAQTTFWRLTLMVDDGFWFDTQKLQAVWQQPPKDLVEALTELLKYL
jgi:nucleoside-diphosphate-sugar epimerase